MPITRSTEYRLMFLSDTGAWVDCQVHSADRAEVDGYALRSPWPLDRFRVEHRRITVGEWARTTNVMPQPRACPGTSDMDDCGSLAAEGDRYCLHCRDAIQRSLAQGDNIEFDDAEHAANSALMREV